MTSIRLFRGAFGHVSVLNVSGDLVTHAHAEPHIVIHVDGSPGTMVVGGRKVFPAPDVAIGVNAYEPHSHSFLPGEQPGRFLAFYIDPDWVAARHGAGFRVFRKTVVPLDDWLRVALSEILSRDCDDLSDYEAGRLVECLMDAATRASVSAQSERRGAAHSDHRLRKAMTLMETHIGDRMCFDELARSVGLSRPHFFALFREHMNMTPNVYWNTLRMGEALRQVEASEESLTAVAFNLGFSSQGNFTRFFRDHAGVTPTLYREASRSAA